MSSSASPPGFVFMFETLRGASDIDLSCLKTSVTVLYQYIDEAREMRWWRVWVRPTEVHIDSRGH
jgi:hypothetical protein